MSIDVDTEIDVRVDLWSLGDAVIACGHSLHAVGARANHDDGEAVCYVHGECLECGTGLTYPACEMWKQWVLRRRDNPMWWCVECGRKTYTTVEVVGTI